ncbi:hypothetical protein F66182_8499 [Fusarium sp. NRRL 66182]|nr:hypothetical protein F66182_8499 [Fusarium sp. NRRL 66182]
MESLVGRTVASYSSSGLSQVTTDLPGLLSNIEELLLTDQQSTQDLRYLRLAHSTIRDGLDRKSEHGSNLLESYLYEVGSYVASIRKCGTTARHLRLQKDPGYMKHPKVVFRLRKLAEQLQEARIWAELLQYRLEEKLPHVLGFDVGAPRLRDWLKTLIPKHVVNHNPTPGSAAPLSKINLAQDWLKCPGKLLWCSTPSRKTSSNKTEPADEVYSIQDRIFQDFPCDAFVTNITFSTSSVPCEAIDIVLCLISGIIASKRPSLVMKAWYLSQMEARPFFQDAKRILFHELRRMSRSFIVFENLPSFGYMSSFPGLFEEMLKEGHNLLVLSPVSPSSLFLPDRCSYITHDELQTGIKDSESSNYKTDSHSTSSLPSALSHTVPAGRSPDGYNRGASPAKGELYPAHLSEWLLKRDLPTEYFHSRSSGYQGTSGPTPISVGDVFSISDPKREAWPFCINELACEKSVYAKISLDVLTWLGFSFEPLTTEEMRVVVEFSIGHYHTDKQSRPDPFSYATRWRFSQGEDTKGLRTKLELQNELIKDDKPPPDGHHALLARTCISYIKAAYGTGVPPEDDSEVTAWLRRHPFLHYAVKYWGDHARSVIRASDDFIREIVTFLESHAMMEFLVHVFSVDGGHAELHGQAYSRMNGLHLASAFGLTRTASQLISSGSFSPYSKTDDDWTALHWATKSGHLDMVSFLLSLGDMNTLIDRKTRTEGWTALHLATVEGFLPVIEALASANANVNAQDNMGRTSLYLACWYGHVGIIRFLISRGADPNIDNVYTTPLHCAVKRGEIEIVRALVSTPGSDINLNMRDPLQRTALEEAQERGQHKIAAFLIESGAQCREYFHYYNQHAKLQNDRATRFDWQAYEIDQTLSQKIKNGNQCICHVLRPQKISPETPKLVFQKTFDIGGSHPEKVQKYSFAERQILYHTRHPHIVQYIDSMDNPTNNTFVLFMEYCEEGDLATKHGISLVGLSAEDKRYGFLDPQTVQESVVRPLTGIETWSMIWQLASALAYLHYGLAIRNQGAVLQAVVEDPWEHVIHRDIKPANSEPNKPA